MHFEVARIVKPQGGTTVAAKPVIDVPTLKINGVPMRGATLGVDGWKVDLSDAFGASKVKYSLKQSGNDYEIKTQ